MEAARMIPVSGRCWLGGCGRPSGTARTIPTFVPCCGSKPHVNLQWTPGPVHTVRWSRQPNSRAISMLSPTTTSPPSSTSPTRKIRISERDRYTLTDRDAGSTTQTIRTPASR